MQIDDDGYIHGVGVKGSNCPRGHLSCVGHGSDSPRLSRVTAVSLYYLVYMAEPAELGTALDRLYAGDLEGLRALLTAHPSLVHARAVSVTPPYDGYFHGATLLHHVAGNPTVHPLPASTPELARAILAHGAEVDAATEAGPSQPDDVGWTTLGLVASSLDARAAGHQLPLLELLLAHGADPGARQGGTLMGALYYGEQDAARYLAAHGAPVDLIAAAGLGRIDLMAPFVTASGALAPEAHTLVHYGLTRVRPASDAERLTLALVYAALGGHADAAAWLLDRGADPAARAPFDHGATPLHWAAYRGHAGVVELLLRRGADRTLEDATFHGTPRGWAEHAGHGACAKLLS